MNELMTLLKKGRFGIFFVGKWDGIIENELEIIFITHEIAENHMQSGRNFVVIRENRVFSVESLIN